MPQQNEMRVIMRDGREEQERWVATVKIHVNDDEFDRSPTDAVYRRQDS